MTIAFRGIVHLYRDLQSNPETEDTAKELRLSLDRVSALVQKEGDKKAIMSDLVRRLVRMQPQVEPLQLENYFGKDLDWREVNEEGIRFLTALKSKGVEPLQPLIVRMVSVAREKFSFPDQVDRVLAEEIALQDEIERSIHSFDTVASLYALVHLETRLHRDRRYEFLKGAQISLKRVLTSFSNDPHDNSGIEGLAAVIKKLHDHPNNLISDAGRNPFQMWWIDQFIAAHENKEAIESIYNQLRKEVNLHAERVLNEKPFELSQLVELIEERAKEISAQLR